VAINALECSGVARYLFRGRHGGLHCLAHGSEPPQITAVLAGTVAAIYDYLQTMIDLEIDEREGTPPRAEANQRAFSFPR
jgi:hypothetical protein